MLPKYVYCIPANWNFTLVESKLQILFFVLIKQANNQLFKQIGRISFWGNFGWVYLPVKRLLRSGSCLNCKYLPTSPLITSRFVQMVSTAVISVKYVSTQVIARYLCFVEKKSTLLKIFTNELNVYNHADSGIQKEKQCHVHVHIF